MPVAAIPDARLTLPDGRTLAYAQWGDGHGTPVLLLHGVPGSRLFVPNLLVTAACAVRLVTVDRPGYGGSDPDPGRTILDWAADVEALADALSLDRFAVVGHSAGGPYALACAVRLSERVLRLALVSPAVPVHEFAPSAEARTERERRLVDLAGRDPAAAARQVAGEAGWLLTEPELFLDLPRPRADALLLADKDLREMYLATLREAVRQGLDAFAHEQVLERRPWGVALEEVGVPVQVWHGGKDTYVPAPHVAELARRLPQATLELDPAAGHGLIVQRWGDILRRLTTG